MTQNIGLSAMFEDANFQRGIGAYEKSVQHAEQSTDHAAGVLSKLGAVAGGALVVGFAAAAAGAAALFAAGKIGLDVLSAWNDQVNTLSDNLGTSGEQSSAWAVAFNHVGLSVDEGGAGLNFFVKSLSGFDDLVKQGKGDTSAFGKSLKELGINAYDSRGKLRTFDELMPDLLDRFQKLPAGVNKSALAMQLFGARAGTKFLDFLSQGSEGLADARKMAKEFGLELSTDESNAVEDFGFQLNDLNLGLKGFWIVIGREVLPIASRLVSFVTHDILPPFIKWAQDVIPLLVKNVTSFVTLVGGKVIPPLTSLWNIVKLLVTGDFSGGIFGLSEDSPLIDFLLTARETVTGLFDAISKGDWGAAWGVVTGGLGHVGELIVTELGKIWTNSIQPNLTTWGTNIWNWITDTALPALGGKLGELKDGVGVWLAENGPKAWTQLVAWSTDFWDWLVGKDGALGKAGVKVLEIASAIGTEIDKAWISTVQPALARWGSQFWLWLTDEGGALDQLGTKLTGLSTAFLTWADSAAGKSQIEGAGGAIVDAVWDAIGSLFEKKDNPKANSAFERFAVSLAEAVLTSEKAFKSIGATLADKIVIGLIEKITGQEVAGKTKEAVEAWLKAALFGDVSGLIPAVKLPTAPPWIPPPPQPGGGGASDFGMGTPPAGGGTGTTGLFGGGSTVPASNANAAGLIAAQQQILATPVNLKVMIGEQEIKNASLQYSYEAVTSAFNEAAAATSQGESFSGR